MKFSILNKPIVLIMALILPPLPQSIASNSEELSRSTHTEINLFSKAYNFWLGQNVGVWTGLPYEFHYPSQSHFHCSINCYSSLPSELNEEAIRAIPIANKHRYESDDDTDIEAIYLVLMEEKTRSKGSVRLTADEISRGWDRFIHKNDGGSPDQDPNGLWGSNQNFLIEVRQLLKLSNDHQITLSDIENGSNYWRFSDYIDAQLTTEVFGAISPSTTHAVDLARLPIRMVASSEIGSIARFYVALTASAFNHYGPTLSLAHLAERSDVRQHLEGLPAEVFDYIRDEYDSNRGIPFTEMRRKVNERFQFNFQKSGEPWTDMIKGTVNFSSFVMAMYLGQTEHHVQGSAILRNDIRKTIQYAVGGGNDADNSAATIAGILGALHGDRFQEELFGYVSHDHQYDWAQSPADGSLERPGLDQKRLNSIKEFAIKTLAVRGSD